MRKFAGILLLILCAVALHAAESVKLRIVDATRTGDDAIRQLALACALANENFEVAVERATVPEALREFAAGKADLVLIDAARIPADFQGVRRRYAVEALVCYTALSNPVRGLTRARLVELLTAERPVWSDFGGERVDIQRIGLKDAGPTRGLAEALLLNVGKTFPAPGFAVRTTPEAVLLAGANPAGLAYGHFLPSAPATVRMLAIDGVEPKLNTVAEGLYPLTVFYSILSPEKPGPGAQILFKAMRGGEFYELVEESGRLPLAPTEK